MVIIYLVLDMHPFGISKTYLCNKIDAHLEKLVFTSFFCVLRVKISGV